LEYLKPDYITMSISTEELQKAVSEILDAANLDEVTTKAVRKQLEEKN